MMPEDKVKNLAAECFPLRVYIAEELEARGWSVDDLCRGTAMPEHRVQELLASDDFHLSLREAEWLGCALGVSAALLLNLQRTYSEWKSRK
jgi:plasmid maintenance system antidote protein VapI